jgi:hypothetical protein
VLIRVRATECRNCVGVAYDNAVVLRVYLDQAKWLDFSKCRLGRDDGAHFADAYTLANEAVSTELVSFPLSAAHYFETHHRGDWVSRLDLATTMAGLSKFHTIAPPHRIVPAEILAALGGPPMSQTVRLFGVGVSHAFGGDIPLDLMQLPDDIEVPPGLRSQLATEFVQMMEFAILANPQFADGTKQLTLDAARKTIDIDEKFAAGQAKLAEGLDEHKLRGRLGDAMTATELIDIMDPLIRACLALGVDLNALVGDRERMQTLLQNVPSRWVTREMRRLRHRNPQQRWHPHDLNDVNALSVAVPYCDVVVTERQWAHHLIQSGLATTYGATVIHDLTELTAILVSATASAS